MIVAWFFVFMLLDARTEHGAYPYPAAVHAPTLKACEEARRAVYSMQTPMYITECAPVVYSPMDTRR